MYITVADVILIRQRLHNCSKCDIDKAKVTQVRVTLHCEYDAEDIVGLRTPNTRSETQSLPAMQTRDHTLQPYRSTDALHREMS